MRSRLVAAAFCLILCGSSASADAPWPTLHGDAQRSGCTHESVSGPYERKWYRLFTEEMIATRVEGILAERKCYVGTFAGNLYALNVEDGSTAWKFRAGGPIGASPRYHDGRLFFGADDGTLYCLNAADGSLEWAHSVGSGIWVSPACDGARVYFGDRGGTFHALDADTGREVWRFRTGGMILTPASLSPDGQKIVFGSEDMHAYCLDPSGELLWKSEKLGGLSLQDHAPTIWRGLAIFRTNPAKAFHEAAGMDPGLLTRTQKELPTKPEDEVLRDKWGQFVMRLTPRRADAERRAVIDYLRDHRSERTFYALRLSDGREPWTAPVLYTAGLHNPATPPVFDPETGELYVIFPTALAAERSGVPGGSICLGTLDRQTGHVRHLSTVDMPYPGFLQPGDETQSLSLTGDLVLNTHQGSVAGITRHEQNWSPVWTARDTYGGIYGPSALPDYWDDVEEYVKNGYLVGMPNEWHGPDSSVVSIGHDRFFWVVGSMVVCIGGPDTPATHTGGTEPPAPMKREIDPCVPCGNVAAGVVGAFDDSVDRRPIRPDDLRKYVDRTPPKVAPTASPEARKLRKKLDAEVLELVDEGPWAPFVVELGITGEKRYFRRTSQVMQTVALALPHLSKSVREKARAYLRGLLKEGAPLDEPTFPGRRGTRREAYDLGPSMLKFAGEQPPYEPGVQDLYAVWACAHYADCWDLVRPLRDRLTALFERFAADPPEFNHEPQKNSACQHLNARIAGVLAYARIMRRLGEADRVDRALELLADMVTDRVHHERADTRFVRATRRLHEAKIPRYLDMVPELADVLREHAPEALESNVRGIMGQLPVWYHAFGERLIGGENYTSPPTLTRGLFVALADGLRARPEELTEYLDHPWCRADLYYVEKLSAVLRRAGRSAGREGSNVS